MFICVVTSREILPLFTTPLSQFHYHHPTPISLDVSAEAQNALHLNVQLAFVSQRSCSSFQASERSARPTSLWRTHIGPRAICSERLANRSSVENPNSARDYARAPEPRVLRTSDRRPRLRPLRWSTEQLHDRQLGEHDRYAMLSLGQT